MPRQYSTGGLTQLFSISKRGNAYLRRMFIRGARAALWRVKYHTGVIDEWARQLGQRAAKNIVAVALASKLARIAWGLSSGERYCLQPAPAAGLELAVENIAMLGKRLRVSHFPGDVSPKKGPRIKNRLHPGDATGASGRR